jgi:hypothetical protein
MTRQPPKSDYEAARRKLAQHLWHHHHQQRATGTLGDRLNYHDDLHWDPVASELLHHEHAEMPDDETQEQTAQRYFDEGDVTRTARG